MVIERIHSHAERGNEHKRGYVDQGQHWRYSSARNHAGQNGLLEVCKQW